MSTSTYVKGNLSRILHRVKREAFSCNTYCKDSFEERREYVFE